MALPRVGVSIGVTLNMGNYETVRAEALFHRDVEPKEDPQDVYLECAEQAHAGLTEALEGVREVLTSMKGGGKPIAVGKSSGPVHPKR